MPGEPDLPKDEEHELQNCSVVVGQNFFNRLEKHVLMRSRMTTEDLNKQTWVADAIRAKIRREKDAKLGNMAKEKWVTVKLDKATRDAVSAQVNILRKFHRTYSQKKWILEAIEEKLEEEEDEVREWFQKLQETIST